MESRRILVVDDDEISRLVAEEILRNLGAAVDTAATPEEAMGLTGQHRYDLILLDVNMPGMNGLELARVMTTLDASLRGKVALLTAGEHSGASSQAAQASGLRIFLKPLDPGQFRDFIARSSRLHAPCPHASPSTVAAHPPIEGIDIAAGMNNFMGSEQSYFSTLAAFPAYGQRFLEEFSLHLHDGNARECNRLAHSLKGSSAMIGAMEIHATAREIESAYGGDPDPQNVEALFRRLKKQMLKTIAGVCASLESRASSFDNS